MAGLEIDIVKIIGSAVRAAVEAKTREIMERAKAELDAEIPKIVAGVTLEFQKYISIESRGKQVMITIRKTT